MTAPGERDEAGTEQPGLGKGAAEMAALRNVERRAQGPTVGEFYDGLAGGVKNPALAARLREMAGSQADRIWAGPDAAYNLEERTQPPETEENARAQMESVIRTIDMAMQGKHESPSPGLSVSFAEGDEFTDALKVQIDQILGVASQPVSTPENDGAGHSTARYETQVPGLQLQVWTESENVPEGGKLLETRYNLVPIGNEAG